MIYHQILNIILSRAHFTLIPNVLSILNDLKNNLYCKDITKLLTRTYDKLRFNLSNHVGQTNKFYKMSKKVINICQ